MENDVYYVWLSLLKRRNKRKLINDYDSVKSLYYDIDYDDKETDFLKAQQVLDKCRKNNIGILTYEQFGKIELLKGMDSISTKPFVLYYKGKIIHKKTGVAIVGSRRCTQQDKNFTLELTEMMATEDTAIISGMAKGVDSYAHTKALMLNRYTVAVIGCGIDICYPKEHDRLMREISEKGLIISEYPPETPPIKYNFPRRNRIIAALSDEIHVVGAKRGSGALITAEYGEKYGRKVYFH